MGILVDFHRHGLLFLWEQNGRKYAHWTGSEKEGRLPPPSLRARYPTNIPLPPIPLLEKYLAEVLNESCTSQDEVLPGLGLGLGLGVGLGLGSGLGKTSLYREKTDAAAVEPKALPDSQEIADEAERIAEEAARRARARPTEMEGLKLAKWKVFWEL